MKFEDSEVEKCEGCKVEFKKSEKHKNGHYFLYVPLKDQLILLVKSKYFIEFRKTSDEESDIINGDFYRILREHGNIGDNDITIQWFVDGIKTFI